MFVAVAFPSLFEIFPGILARGRVGPEVKSRIMYSTAINTDVTTSSEEFHCGRELKPSLIKHKEGNDPVGAGSV